MLPDTAASKVTAAHLSRRALLYIRQSSLKQVIHNTESAIRQYDLRGKATALGWAADQVLPGAQDPHLGGVHDADEEPGISGGVVGKVPVHMGKVPDSRQIFGGDCCLRAGAGRERRGRFSRPGPWSAVGRGSAC